jgi:hypothetical protein
MEMPDHPLEFLIPHLNYHDILHHIFVGCSLLAYIDPDGSGDDVVHKKLGLFLHCGGEEQGLPVFPGLPNYRSDLLLKTQGKHPISFVQHQVSHSHQGSCFLLQHLNQSTR